MTATTTRGSYIPTTPFALRHDKLVALIKNAGLTSRRFGELVGAHESTVSRLRAGTIRQPSNRVVGGILAAFPDAAFEDLFEVDDPQK